MTAADMEELNSILCMEGLDAALKRRGFLPMDVQMEAMAGLAAAQMTPQIQEAFIEAGWQPDSPPG